MINPCRVALALALTLPTILASQVQLPGLTLPPDAPGHLAAVVKIFTTSYANYKKLAWGHDNLGPLTQTPIDDRNGWGATIVDSMSTMHVMGLTDAFDEAVKFVGQIDFSKSKTSDTVSVFETTIRYIGGLLSAYELTDQKNPILLQKAKECADKLAFAWVGNNDIPFRQIDFSNNQPVVENSNIAEAGSLILEWTKLSAFTGNKTYADLALKAFRRIATNAAPLPGLAAQGIDPKTGKSVGGYVTWGGGSDSYFEYLIKYPRLTNTQEALFADTWYTAVHSSNNVLKSTSTVGGHVYLADYDNKKQVRHVGSHLACFHAGNWILGGRLLDEQTIVDQGLELNEACWNTYASTATGIGPETFSWVAQGGDLPKDEAQLNFYNEHGFYITTPYYAQRPEVIESNFYAWRATGDKKYYDRAVQAVDSLNKHSVLADGNGFAAIKDVNSQVQGNDNLLDSSESFWYAETLKYLYLTFSAPNVISLDEYVLNTECHPFKAPPAAAQYGTKTVLPDQVFDSQSDGGMPLPQVSPVPNVKAPPLAASINVVV